MLTVYTGISHFRLHHAPKVPPTVSKCLDVFNTLTVNILDELG